MRLFVVCFIILALTSSVLSSSVYASQSLSIVVENAETKECAFYSAGDEFHRNRLPVEWNPSVKCSNMSIYDNENLTMKEYFAKITACCEEQGFVFIEKDVGRNSFSFEGLWFRLAQNPLAVLLPALFIAVFAFAILKYIQIKKKYKKN